MDGYEICDILQFLIVIDLNMYVCVYIYMIWYDRVVKYDLGLINGIVVGVKFSGSGRWIELHIVTKEEENVGEGKVNRRIPQLGMTNAGPVYQRPPTCIRGIRGHWRQTMRYCVLRFFFDCWYSLNKYINSIIQLHNAQLVKLSSWQRSSSLVSSHYIFMLSQSLMISQVAQASLPVCCALLRTMKDSTYLTNFSSHSGTTPWKGLRRRDNRPLRG